MIPKCNGEVAFFSDAAPTHRNRNSMSEFKVGGGHGVSTEHSPILLRMAQSTKKARGWQVMRGMGVHRSVLAQLAGAHPGECSWGFLEEGMHRLWEHNKRLGHPTTDARVPVHMPRAVDSGLEILWSNFQKWVR